MDENPYESPREAGYISEAYAAFRAWMRDRIALVLTAVTIFAAIEAGVFLSAWMSGKL